jgi:hypothetical protein
VIEVLTVEPPGSSRAGWLRVSKPDLQDGPRAGRRGDGRLVGGQGVSPGGGVLARASDPRPSCRGVR